MRTPPTPWRTCVLLGHLALLVGCGSLQQNSGHTGTASTTPVTSVTPVITWTQPASISAGTALGATQLNATANVPGSFTYNPAAGAMLAAGSHTLTALFTPSDATTYLPATASVTLTVAQPPAQTAPTISWKQPASVPAGTALGATQLNATASVPGTFSYSPAAGTVLAAGSQTLTTTFTPSDTTAYTTATASVSLTVTQPVTQPVTQATPIITWNPPASIPNGTALGTAQLNATANVPGTFTYSPAAGTVLDAGSHTLTASFEPTDTTDYSSVTMNNSITVTASAPPPTGPVVNLNPGMNTQALQSAISGAPNGATIVFAAGTYNITSPLNISCNNLQITGPVATPPTAILSASFTNGTIFGYPGGCSNLGSVQYLHFENTGAVYLSASSSNFTFDHNLVTNLPSVQGGDYSVTESGVFIDGSLSPMTTTSNVVIEYNTFGDPSSCSAVFATGDDEGGYCAGITTHTGLNNGLTIEYNNFIHVEEGIHLNQLATYSPGATNSGCTSCVIEYNSVTNYHRIGIEIQVYTTNTMLIEHNAVLDPLASSYGTFAVSLACCVSGPIQGNAGYSPSLNFNDNVLIASQPCGGECPPYGVEFWGEGAQGTNSLVQGSFSNGYTWGYGSAPWAITNNNICGPNYVKYGGYISNEENQNNPPAQSGNTTGTSCSATASTAPTISPSGGSFSGSQIVTLSDSGSNTGIWYTTDGSNPVPGAGTTQYYTGPFTLTNAATVKAVGMWGSVNEPTSYPSGYGYVPSSVVTAAFAPQ